MNIIEIISEKSKAVYRLEIILHRMPGSRKLDDSMIDELSFWIGSYRNLKNMCPFSDLYDNIVKIKDDKRVEEELKAELLGFCSDFQRSNGPLDQVVKELQKLHGYVVGLNAEKHLSQDQLECLGSWMRGHYSYANKWPFNKVKPIIDRVLVDGTLSQEGQSNLMKFLEGSMEAGALNIYNGFENENIEITDSYFENAKTIDCIIDSSARVTVEHHSFCFTGKIKTGDRSYMHMVTTSYGGIAAGDVSENLDYLVVGGLSNPCWVYSTYGHKIEKALEYNRLGADIKIISEEDFIEALVI